MSPRPRASRSAGAGRSTGLDTIDGVDPVEPRIVATGAAVHEVAPAIARQQRVAALTSGQDVLPRARAAVVAAQRVRPPLAAQLVAPLVTEQLVVQRAAVQEVVPRSAAEHVVPASAEDA